MGSVSQNHFGQRMNGNHSLTGSPLISTGRACAICKGYFDQSPLGYSAHADKRNLQLE